MSEGYFDKRKRELTESNPTLQKRAAMTTQEKRLGAIETMARSLKEGAEKTGREVTYTEARAEAVRIAERTFNKHDK
jgi:L-lactate utilization protein LutB